MMDRFDTEKVNVCRIMKLGTSVCFTAETSNSLNQSKELAQTICHSSFFVCNSAADHTFRYEMTPFGQLCRPFSDRVVIDVRNGTVEQNGVAEIVSNSGQRDG
jgi:hypothetical protein